MSDIMGNALAKLRKVFGYSAFRGSQADIISHVTNGGDALVLMPTGGGKSLCYQLPALLRPGTALVISPLIALMQNQVSALKAMGVRAEYLNSTLSAEEARAICYSLRQGKLDLLYVSPERALMPGFAEMISACPLALIAIDEAHCVSQWGHDFRPEYLQLAELHRLFPEVPRIALTATADDTTRRDIIDKLELQSARCFITGFDRPNIRYLVVPKEGNSEKLHRSFLKFMEAEHKGQSGIIYRQTRSKAEETAKWLCREGYEALPYHAGMTLEDRARNQHRFIHEDGIIISATVAFGMGIDKPDVRFVAHFDMPKSIEAYYQETGRAGRDGLPATAWMAYGLSDVIGISKLMEQSQADEEHQKLEKRKLNAMLGYCETAECRRKVLLRYFGEDYSGNCGNCDTCLDHAEKTDGTIPMQKALSCIYRTGERYGASYLIKVLLGKTEPRMIAAGHDKIPTFGIGKEYSASLWSAILRQTVAGGYAKVDMEFGGLCLTREGRMVLKGLIHPQLRLDICKDSEKSSKAKKKSARPLKSTFKEALGNYAGRSELFEKLRAKRMELARREGVPPYIIFNDSTLIAMIKSLPQNHDDFAELPGVGQVKLEKYADEFLAVLAESSNIVDPEDNAGI